MKSYILCKDKRLILSNYKYYLLEDGLKSLYPYLKEHHFVVIHLKYNPQTLISAMPEDPSEVRTFILESDIQIGILFKKGDMSMDTFLKSYGLD